MLFLPPSPLNVQSIFHFSWGLGWRQKVSDPQRSAAKLSRRIHACNKTVFLDQRSILCQPQPVPISPSVRCRDTDLSVFGR